MQGFKPMRGCAVNYDKLKYPIFASIKGDGIRTNIVEGHCRTKSLKPLPNVYTRELLEYYPVLEGLEAELTTTDDLADPLAFNKATSAFMRHKGNPTIFMWIFDIVLPDVPFYQRLEFLNNLDLPEFARVLPQTLCNTREELDSFVTQCLSLRYEGVMVRHHDSLYKFGMATTTKGELLKIKPMMDDEAIFIGIEEGSHNTNEKTTNELGRGRRSSAKDGMVPSGTTGSVLAEHPTWGILRISGFSDELAQDMFDNTKDYIGRLLTFRYQDHGTMDSPRLPKFKGWRSPEDISLPEEK